MAQPTLFNETPTPEDAAFADGTLSVMEKAHDRYDSRAWGGHVRAGEFLTYAGPFATIHVISRHAGGEIRGYVRINGTLYRRTPSYPTEWPELDAAVSAHLGAPVIADERDPAALR